MMSFARLRTLLAPWAGGIAVLAMLCAHAQAQTPVSGEIAANTRWTQNDSPYIVSGELTVRGGAMLTIDAGVTVYMASGSSLTVLAGNIQAIGSNANPIRVLSDKARQGLAAAPGDWNQWVFANGTTGTRLEHVHFQHGKGLQVNGAAPVFNYLDIRDQQGPAIAIDLAASPTGVGNRASGNTINGIAVPAGDVAGSVRWGLRGIPYVVGSGVVSVGASPALNSVSPTTVEQGQTLTLTLNGARLDGLARVSSDKAGLTFTPFSGGSSAQVFVQLGVNVAAPVGAASLRVQVDAGEVVLPNAITITPPMPTVTGLDPSTVLAGVGATDITVSGRNFASNSEVLFNAASVPTTFVSTTQVRATLPNQSATGALQAQVRTPDASNPGQYLLSNQVALQVQAPVPPVVAIEPTPIALPPDDKPREITIRFSKADYRDNVLNFSISDTSKATITPASLLIPAGQTTAKVTVVPKVTGTVNLVIESANLQRVSVPLFITADFRGANTAYAMPVGVMVQGNATGTTQQVTVANANVGVAVGGVLTQVSPRAWPMGAGPTVTIRGVAIPSGAQVSVVPATGITVGTPVLNADATELSVVLATAADAPIGPRKLIVRDAAGKELVFADPAQSVVQVMTGVPSIESIEPIFGARGTTFKLLVRGRHLQQGQLRLLPATGLRVDVAPVVSADGTQLTAFVEIAADAPVGDRVVQVVTPAGVTASTLVAHNTFAVVSSVREAVTPIASRLVGVVVGNATTARTEQATSATSVVGVLLGTGVSELAPNTGVIGTEVVVTARGAGLQGVTAASLTPAAGVSIGALSVNETGTELRFTVTVEAGASLGARRLVLTGANGLPVTFSRPTDGSFLISAPVPELVSTEPQVLLAGQGTAVKLTLRGRNLINVTSARIEPAQGITVAGPFETNAEGTTLSFTVTVAAGASSGTRAVVVSSAAGESTTTVHAGNMVRIANQLGATYANLLSAPVGVAVGDAGTPSESFDGALASAAVGVQVGTTASSTSIGTTLSSRTVGVIFGAAAHSMTPSGWLQGASGEIVVTGSGLDAATSVSVVPTTGLLLGAPVASEGGTRLTVPVSVAPDAPQVQRQLLLATASGAPVSFTSLTAATFGIGSLPTMTSMSPIVFEQGKGAALVVRGSNLKGVIRVSFEPGSGLRAAGEFTWSQDALGELLTVPVFVDTGAALGSRVVRLEVHGGITPAEATPANTINVVAPQ